MYDFEMKSADFNYINGSSKLLEELLKSGTENQLKQFTKEIFNDFEARRPTPLQKNFLAVSLFSAVCRAASDDRLAGELFSEIEKIGVDGDYIADRIGGELTLLCLRAREGIKNKRRKSAYLICEEALSIIERDYGNENLSLSSVSKHLHVSPNYLSAIFKKVKGCTFTSVLTQKRMETALDCLLHTNMKILEISDKCGYSDRHYFSRCFKKYFGTSPNTLRNRK